MEKGEPTSTKSSGKVEHRGGSEVFDSQLPGEAQHEEESQHTGQQEEKEISE